MKINFFHQNQQRLLRALANVLGLLALMLVLYLVALPFYLRAKKINILGFLDLVSVYAPLLQSISRIGCFLAGCCYGSPTSVFWAVRSSAGTGGYVHPTQLYSTFILFLIFLIMRGPGRVLLKKPGQLLMLYLILVSVERFVVDFWRGDREFLVNAGFWGICSVHQYIAIGLCVVALIIMFRITVRAQQKNESV